MILPIDAALPGLVQVLRKQNLVLVAPPGAGKTTGLPPALLAGGACDRGEIWVLQPRRLAARLAAERVSAGLAEPVGQRCGYQVRFDAAVSSATQIRFVTHGLLVRRLRESPELAGIGTVIIDEFHERQLDADVALALLRRLQSRRSDLRIVVMSATMQPDPLAIFLDAPVHELSGRAFPVETRYVTDDRPLESRVLRAFGSLVDDGVDGHILVFLPGAREIRACEAACRRAAESAGFAVHVLHGEGTRQSQLAAVAPSTTSKLILSTNVAETSITIDGVGAVIDSGLARVARDDPWSGETQLRLCKISRASADQRAGRAGRTHAGHCLRLYSRHDFDHRPAYETPEIRRSDLASTLLDLLAADVDDVGRFEWFETPPQDALSAASALLAELGATAAGKLSAIGRRMIRFPTSPRVARLLVETEDRGVAELGAAAAALIGERSIRGDRRPADRDADADVLVEMQMLDQVRRDPHAAGRWGLLPATCRRVEQVRRQLGQLVQRSVKPPPTRDAQEEALRMSMLTAYPDRVARIQQDGSSRRTLVLCRGGSALQCDSSVVRSAPWVIGLAVERRQDHGRRPNAAVRSVCSIEPEWLIDMFADHIVDEVHLEFDAQSQRVIGRSDLRYGQLVIESSELRQLPPRASEILAEAALAVGFERFVDEPADVLQLLSRTRFAHALDADLVSLSEDDVRATLAEMCEGRVAFAQVRRADLVAHLHLRLGDKRATLDRLAPANVHLAGGRRVRIHYEVDRDPWIASRLQDFFGLREGPRVGAGTPLVLHLRAPNGRDVQVTTDLAGFWERHYPGLRRTLMRRYPKHDWPTDPLAASPPPARPKVSKTTRRRRR